MINKSGSLYYPSTLLQLREQAEALSREKERRRFVKTLRKMYHLSLAHAASTTR